jgi:Bacterial aa3 type cytochrome c oxidase subunit IV
MEAKLAEHQDMRAATDTYSGFLTLFKWGAVVAALAAALVVLIIA